VFCAFFKRRNCYIGRWSAGKMYKDEANDKVLAAAQKSSPLFLSSSFSFANLSLSLPSNTQHTASKTAYMGFKIYIKSMQGKILLRCHISLQISILILIAALLFAYMYAV
jgi:hypothetical protein